MMDINNIKFTPSVERAFNNVKLKVSSSGQNIVNNCYLFCSAWQNANKNFKEYIFSRGVELSDEKVERFISRFAVKYPYLFDSEKKEVVFSPSTTSSIAEALSFAYKKNNYFIGVEHVLYGILNTPDEFCSFLLTQDIDTEHFKTCIESFVSGNIFADDESEYEEYYDDEDGEDEEDDSPDGVKNDYGDVEYGYLKKFGSILNDEVNQPSFPKISGRDNEIALIEQSLCRKVKSNCILVGEAGTGKTSIVEGFAQLISTEEYSGPLQNNKIYSLDMGLLTAGTRYRGQLEDRLSKVIKQLKLHKELILFIDEIHTMIGAGNRENSLDVANMIKPALARGEIKCIGATTIEEYKKAFEKDAALARRFDMINIDEPSKLMTKEMSFKALPSYEKFHKVKYPENVLNLTIDLCETYLPHKRFPDKVFDIIDQASTKTKIKNKKTRTPKVSLDCIYEVVANKINVDVASMKQNYNNAFHNFETDLNKKILGQEQNISKIYDVLSCSKFGFQKPNKPIASFFFVGPTSVGKTFTAKEIACKFYGNPKNILQLNMSEYQETTSISKLIGTSAGYVGFEEGGILTEFVRKNPNSVILFDEVDKCHKNTLDLLLQILDEACISDNFNRKINFSRCIIIMTSNIGNEEAIQKQVGFISQKVSNESSFLASVKKYLRPELVARINEIIVFKSLELSHFEQIISTKLNSIKSILKEKEIELSFCKKTLAHLSSIVKKENNARNIDSIIRNQIEAPLAKFYLKNSKILKISIKVVDNKLLLS
jgi:ATP-dependent Clp protease ATP-binding subunit ClpA